MKWGRAPAPPACARLQGRTSTRAAAAARRVSLLGWCLASSTRFFREAAAGIAPPARPARPTPCRTQTMLQEAGAFLAQLKRVEKDIQGLQSSTEVRVGPGWAPATTKGGPAGCSVQCALAGWSWRNRLARPATTRVSSLHCVCRRCCTPRVRCWQRHCRMCMKRLRRAAARRPSL